MSDAQSAMPTGARPGLGLLRLASVVPLSAADLRALVQSAHSPLLARPSPLPPAPRGPQHIIENYCGEGPCAASVSLSCPPPSSHYHKHHQQEQQRRLLTPQQRALVALAQERAAAAADEASKAKEALAQGGRPRSQSDDVSGVRTGVREERFARLAADERAWWSAHMPDATAHACSTGQPRAETCDMDTDVDTNVDANTNGNAKMSPEGKSRSKSKAKAREAEARLAREVAAAARTDAVCDVEALRRAVWGARGRLAPEDRALVWQLLLGCLPAAGPARAAHEQARAAWYFARVASTYERACAEAERAQAAQVCRVQAQQREAARRQEEIDEGFEFIERSSSADTGALETGVSSSCGASRETNGTSGDASGRNGRNGTSSQEADWEDETEMEEGEETDKEKEEEEDEKELEERTILYRQVLVDVVRTHPTGAYELFDHAATRGVLARVLFVWADAHRGVGYFQGLNEIATPLLAALVCGAARARTPARGAVAGLASDDLKRVEARLYDCVDAVMARLAPLVAAAGASHLHSEHMLVLFDAVVRWAHPALAARLAAGGLCTVQYAFRWCLCLLLREFALPDALRLWDALLSDPAGLGLPALTVYVAAAYLLQLAPLLLALGPEAAVVLLNSPPLAGGPRATRRLLAAAVRLRARHLAAQQCAAAALPALPLVSRPAPLRRPSSRPGARPAALADAFPLIDLPPALEPQREILDNLIIGLGWPQQNHPPPPC